MTSHPSRNFLSDLAAIFNRRAKLVFFCAIALSFFLFTFAARLFHIPRQPRFDASFLLSGATLSLGIIALLLVAAVIVATLIAGAIRFDAGLFCATAGMTALSLRSGTMGDLLRSAAATSATPSLFISLAVELVLLYAIVGLAWSALWLMHRSGFLKADEFRDGVEDTDDPLYMKIAALIMQAAVTTLAIIVLLQSDAKMQSLAAVGIASWTGAVAAYYLYPVHPSPWLWVGPMIVGTFGYTFTSFQIAPDDTAWRTGHLTHTLSHLARAIPLDYATAGPAGAILGYWMSRRWFGQQVPTPAVNPTAPTPSTFS